MSDVQRTNTIGDNEMMEMVLRITYKDGRQQHLRFISYRVSLEDAMLYLEVDKHQSAKIPLTLIRHTDEKIISKYGLI